jgi:hypothetical protein
VYGPFSNKEYNNKDEDEQIYAFTFTDRCSRLTQIKFIKKITAKSFIKAYETVWVSQYGHPNSLLTDNGKCYTSKTTKKYLENHGVYHIKTSTYNPTGNSNSERINAHISIVLRIYKGFDLKKIKQIIENRINNVFHSSINDTPKSIVEKYQSGQTIIRQNLISNRNKRLSKINKG